MRRRPHLQPHRIKARRGWAQENAEQDWHRVIFTDEACIELVEHRI